MTEEDRMAVAVTRLRLMGMHPSWIEFLTVEWPRPAAFMEQLADETAAMDEEDGMYGVFKRQR